jgi:hypothetical protein
VEGPIVSGTGENLAELPALVTVSWLWRKPANSRQRREIVIDARAFAELSRGTSVERRGVSFAQFVRSLEEDAVLARGRERLTRMHFVSADFRGTFVFRVDAGGQACRCDVWREPRAPAWRRNSRHSFDQARMLADWRGLRRRRRLADLHAAAVLLRYRLCGWHSLRRP